MFFVVLHNYLLLFVGLLNQIKMKFTNVCGSNVKKSGIVQEVWILLESPLYLQKWMSVRANFITLSSFYSKAMLWSVIYPADVTVAQLPQLPQMMSMFTPCLLHSCLRDITQGYHVDPCLISGYHSHTAKTSFKANLFGLEKQWLRHE